MTTDAFWIDADYDRDNASNGRSRYEVYVNDAAFEPWDSDDPKPAELAMFAWQRATTPVMSPAYVRRHPLILTAQLAASDCNGALIAQVDLVAHQTLPLQYVPAPAGQPVKRTCWADWPYEHQFALDRDVYYEPGGEELEHRGPHLLVSASLRFTVPGADLPQPGLGPADFAHCMRAVQVLVRELNSIVGPVIDRIEGN